jgi:hypothetical protein
MLAYQDFLLSRQAMEVLNDIPDDDYGEAVLTLLTSLVRDYQGQSSVPIDVVSKFAKESHAQFIDLEHFQNIEALLDMIDLALYILNTRIEIVYKSVADTVPVEFGWRQP